MMNKLLLRLALFILPVIFLIIGINFQRTWFSGDPEYAYLLNGINIANLKAVGHTDNPGTPTQIFSAVVLRVAHFLDFSEKSNLQENVLRHPDQFVELERKTLIMLNALMMFLLGLGSFLLLRNIWFSLILQATPFISSNLLEIAFTKVSPEPVLIFTVMALVLVILKYYLDYAKNGRYYPWIFSIIIGFGLASKATFLPLVLLPLWLLQTRKHRITYLVSIIPSFILFTAPAIPQYPHMAKWFLGLSTHTGTYGQGSSGIIDFSTYFNNLPLIVINNPAMSVSILIAIVLIGISIGIGRLRKHSIPLPVRFLIGIATVQLLAILMVAKHYHANHYLIPAISLTGILWIFSILVIKELIGDKPLVPHAFLAPVVLVVLLLFGISNRKYLSEAYHGYVITNEEYANVKGRLDSEFPGYLKTYYYPVSINPYSALRWGNVYSRQLHLDALNKLYPEGVFYDTRTNQFQVWESALPIQDLATEYGQKILLIGGPMTDSDKDRVIKGGLSLNEIYRGRTQAIYEVDVANSAIFQGIGEAPIWKVDCNADSLSHDKKFFLSGNFSFQNNDNQTAEKVRSGSYSVKLSYRDSYAMGIEIDSINPGQKFRFTAWRLGGDGTAFLVAASGNKDGFYVQNSESIITDNSGWEKVILEITIPPTFTEGAIKFYLWNNGDSVVYFDDLLLERIR